MGDTNEGMRARLLLVHSPLVGSGTWEPVADELAAAGYAVTVPDLAGAIAAGPPYHLRQAQVIAGSAQQLSHHLALLTAPGRVAGELRRGRPGSGLPPAESGPDVEHFGMIAPGK